MSCYVQSRIEGARGGEMIEMRRAQLSFGNGLIAEEVSDLREEWMQHADQVLADEQIVAAGARSTGEAVPEEPQSWSARHDRNPPGQAEARAAAGGD
ncbi:hypothetical protein [Bradyrhizobium sp. 141]|uniref:hypothetical protein n=1 Tax=Bradyrhizobium sp. 141 TaxID=2782617 RepID=UPI001FF7A5B0|nr:hypothetical protein [Bradyrhizobium sp. 141]MCK1721559.1 hypothetical protein [Bradyrhizobium sp. 141]